MQQNDLELQQSLFKPVKDKLVDPALHEKGFYNDRTHAQAKSTTADQIASEMMEYIIQRCGST